MSSVIAALGASTAPAAVSGFAGGTLTTIAVGADAGVCGQLCGAPQAESETAARIAIDDATDVAADVATDEVRTLMSPSYQTAQGDAKMTARAVGAAEPPSSCARASARPSTTR